MFFKAFPVLEVVGILLAQLDCETFHMDLRPLPRIPWQSDKPMTIPEVKVLWGLNPSCFIGIRCLFHGLTSTEEVSENALMFQEYTQQLSEGVQ